MNQHPKDDEPWSMLERDPKGSAAADRQARREDWVLAVLGDGAAAIAELYPLAVARQQRQTNGTVAVRHSQLVVLCQTYGLLSKLFTALSPEAMSAAIAAVVDPDSGESLPPMLKTTLPTEAEYEAVMRRAIEDRAKVIYDERRQGDPEGMLHPWVEGGNSLKQDEARRAAIVEIGGQTQRDDFSLPSQEAINADWSRRVDAVREAINDGGPWPGAVEGAPASPSADPPVVTSEPGGSLLSI